ncbi:MAG: hypothetical protein GY928_00560 [Colwellia sp.]|nr:hypothetical protein [Colwellia sp.]
MNVGQLIKRLEKLPTHLEVGFSAHDNTTFEVSAWISSVKNMNMKDFNPNAEYGDLQMIQSNPKQYVVLRN